MLGFIFLFYVFLTADNNEDLLSIKPKWETLDSDSDGDGSDDSFKSLRLNIRPASISTPPQRMLDSESLQKYKKRLSLLSSAEPTPEKVLFHQLSFILTYYLLYIH